MNAVLLSSFTGLCVAGIAYANLTNYSAAIDFIEADLKERLRALRISSKHVRRWVNTWLGIVATVFLVLWIGLDAVALAAPVAVIMCAGPWYVVRRAAEARRQKIEDQLADAMVMFSSAIRAGLSIPQSMELLALECPKPISQEFHQIVGEYKLGKPLERTLTEAKERLKSENFVLFAAALLASRESGGRLNETVERISHSVVELQRLERKVVSETAQARKSAVYMAIVPPLLLFVYAFVDPVNTERLFTTLPGQLILSASLVLNLVAYLWALKILKADI
ncbi:MAG TPA: type II secretion system F family protein [Pirellulaceae bacterium]|nr:type II secretion system F family protein [Pirellulaceae bacterium]